jgi:hypothetical protein
VSQGRSNCKSMKHLFQTRLWNFLLLLTIASVAADVAHVRAKTSH